MPESTTELPAIGDAVLVNISPSIKSDQKWMQIGHLLTVRQDPIGLICGTIGIARQLTAEEDLHGWLTDDNWIGCVVDAVYNPFSADWRATRPVSDLAKAVWAKCWERENGN